MALSAKDSLEHHVNYMPKEEILVVEAVVDLGSDLRDTPPDDTSTLGRLAREEMEIELTIRIANLAEFYQLPGLAATIRGGLLVPKDEGTPELGFDDICSRCRQPYAVRGGHVGNHVCSLCWGTPQPTDDSRLYKDGRPVRPADHIF
jgi:hypothetical protein